MNSLFFIVFCVVLLSVCELCHAAYSQCGRVTVTPPIANDIDVRIMFGSDTFRGEFPFLVALNYTKDSTFFCGGTLISKKHVLTAAHCVSRTSSASLVPDDVLVILGAYNLRSNEEGVVKEGVLEIRVHPDWNPYSGRYDADIAILNLNQSVSFTNYIQPVCIPDDNAIVEGFLGSIVGWGFTENGSNAHVEYPLKTETNALNASYCYTTDPFVSHISSGRTFCGGGRNGMPAKGDSGGGFFALSGLSWVQYGIVAAIRTDHAGNIQLNAIAIYTNVKLFRPWIIENLGQDFPGNKINLTCEYDDWSFSLCYLHDLDVRSEYAEVDYYGDVKTNEVVEWIQFDRGTMLYLPDGLGSHFKNVKYLEVKSGLNLKRLRRSNFKNFENLGNIHIFGNDIETLDEDILWDLPNLYHFELIENNLKTIPERLFENNTKLKHVHLQSNKLENLPENLFKNNLLLEWVQFDSNSLTSINIDFRSFKNIKRIDFRINVCIDSFYHASQNPIRNANLITDLEDFQSWIELKC